MKLINRGVCHALSVGRMHGLSGVLAAWFETAIGYGCLGGLGPAGS